MSDDRSDHSSSKGSGHAFRALLEFSERFGSMLSRVLLTVLYFVLLGPFALLYRLFADPLHRARPTQSNWSNWESVNDDLREARRQG
jgi:hypothetical protein